MSDQFLGSLIFLGAVGVVCVNALKLGVYFIRGMGHTVDKACDTIVKIHNATNHSPRLDEAVNEVSHSNQLAVRPEQVVNTVSTSDATLAHNIIDVEATEVKENTRSKKEVPSTTSTLPRTEKEWQKLYGRPTLLRHTAAFQRKAVVAA